MSQMLAIEPFMPITPVYELRRNTFHNYWEINQHNDVSATNVQPDDPARWLCNRNDQPDHYVIPQYCSTLPHRVNS